MARGEFSCFLGSNSGQISIFGVKYLRDPPTTRGAIPHYEGGALLVVGGALVWRVVVRSLNQLSPKFRFKGTFRPKRGATNAYRTISRLTKYIGTK